MSKQELDEFLEAAMLAGDAESQNKIGMSRRCD